MDSIIEEIKSRIDIVDLVSETVKLKKAGHSFTGLCPFHSNTKSPAFVVWAETGTWKCFGACNTGGDIFSFVMKRDRLEFREALERLAQRAGVELRQMNPAEREKVQSERKRQDSIEGLLTRAAEFFYRQLWTEGERQAKGLAFARSRALSDEHLKAARWGWSGADNALGEAIKKSDASLFPLAREIGLLRADGKDFTANADGDTVSPDGWLIYPHHRGGKVVYFSGRAVSRIEGGDKSRNLPGPKQVYRADGNIMPIILPADKLALVEGPADAESCRAWGLAAWAMCGAPVSDDENGKVTLEVLRKRAEHSTLYAAMSHDEAGQRFADKIGELISPLVRIVLWPRPEGVKKSDANDLLKAGGTAEQVFALLEESPTYLDTQVQKTSRQRDVKKRAGEIEHLAELVAKLDETERRIYINDIGERKELDISRREFERMVAERLPRPEESGPQYQVIQGRMIHNCLDRFGTAYEQALLNGQLEITGDLVLDDGEEQQRQFTIEFAREDGAKFSAYDVDVDEYAAMNWVYSAWGMNAIVPAGSSVKEHLRVATLMLSKNAKTTYKYRHTGYHSIDGKQVYLTPSGAVGMEGVQVDIERAAERYGLPLHPENVVEAAKASYQFLAMGELFVTIPLLATAYLAPLSSILNPAFSVWLYGDTETYKSGTMALMLSHFGSFTYRTPPASWTGSSEVGLRVAAFMLKDMPLWIDDFTSQATQRGDEDLEAKAGRILRDWGNRSGGLKGRADGGLRKSYKPRGIAVNSAEVLPSIRSIRSRLFMLEMKPEYIVLDDILARYNNGDAEKYRHAMAGYVMWVGERYSELEKSLPKRVEEWLIEARKLKGNTREYSHVATLQTAFELAMYWMVDAGAMGSEESQAMVKLAFEMMLAAGDEQHLDTAVDENPVEKFMSFLEQILADGTAYVRHLEDPTGDVRSIPEAGQRPVNSRFIGWYDNLYWYLLDAAEEMIYARASKLSQPVGVNRRGLRGQLRNKKMLYPDVEDRFTYRMPDIGINPRPRVLRIFRMGQDCISESGTSGIIGTDGTSVSSVESPVP